MSLFERTNKFSKVITFRFLRKASNELFLEIFRTGKKLGENEETQQLVVVRRRRCRRRRRRRRRRERRSTEKTREKVDFFMSRKGRFESLATCWLNKLTRFDRVTITITIFRTRQLFLRLEFSLRCLKTWLGTFFCFRQETKLV